MRKYHLQSQIALAMFSLFGVWKLLFSGDQMNSSMQHFIIMTSFPSYGSRFLTLEDEAIYVGGTSTWIGLIGSVWLLSSFPILLRACLMIIVYKYSFHTVLSAQTSILSGTPDFLTLLSESFESKDEWWLKVCAFKSILLYLVNG